MVWSFLPTKAFTLVCRPIHKHFGGDDITERQEHLHQLSIPKLLREVVDEQVATLRSCTGSHRGGTERERARGWGGWREGAGESKTWVERGEGKKEAERKTKKGKDKCRLNKNGCWIFKGFVVL